MGKSKTKTIGVIDKKHIKKYNLKLSNNKIIQSLGLVYHTNKHINDFHSVDSFNNTLQNLNKIVNKPYYIEYDSIKNSLKYYGKLTEYVCVVINITDTVNFVSTFYPVGKNKIDKKRYNNKTKNKLKWNKIFLINPL